MSQSFFISFSSEELQTALGSELFRAMLDAMPVAVAVLHAVRATRGEVTEFHYSFANKAATQMKAETVKGKRFFLNDDALLFNTMVSVADSGKTEDFVYHYQAEPQKWIHYNIRKFGEGVLLTYENITDRKLASIELQREKLRFAEAEAISHTGSFEWDFIEDKIYWSDEMYRIHGLQPQSETITRNLVLSLVHPEDLARISKKIEFYSRTPGNEEIQYKLRLRDGSVRHMSARFESFRGKSGKITHLSGLTHDVTEKKIKAEELRNITSSLEKQSKGREKREASLEDYKRIIQNSSSAIISVDRKGAITTWNPAAEKLYGYAAEQAIGRQVSGLIVPEENKEIVNGIFARLFSGETIPDFETIKKCRDGNEVEVSVNLVPQKDSAGKITGIVITSKNITALKEAQRYFEEHYAMLKKTEALGRIGNFHFDTGTKRVTWSDELYKIMGVPAGEPMDFESAISFYIEEDRRRLAELSAAALESGTGFEMEATFIPRGSDRQKNIFIRTEVTQDATGKSNGINGIVQDITQRKNFEIQLSDAKEFIEKVTTTIPDLIQIQDIETNTLVYTNQDADYFKRNFGLNTKNPKMTTDLERAQATVHPDDMEKVTTYISDRKKISGDGILEVELKMNNGNFIRSRSKTFKRDSDGNPSQILIITSDITEQKKSQQEQMKEKLKFDEQALFIQGIANASADILFVMNLDTKEIVYTNHAIAEKLGYSAKQIKAMKNPVLDLMHEADLPKMLKHIAEMKTAADNEVREIEYRMKHADGSLSWFRDRNTVFKRDEKGIPIEKLGICQNITERKHAEENIRLLNKTLRDKNKELLSVNNEMKTFTSIAAYDYRETLQTLYTNLEYIISRDAKNFSNTGKANLRKAQTAIQKMKLLTDDIVAYSRLQTMDTSPTKVGLNTVIDNALKELNEKVIQTGAFVEKENLPEITGFPFLLDLLFYHLLDNAIKFRKPNENPHIRIVYHVSTDKHSGSDVHQISIADNGIGLAHEEAGKVFEMFYRIDSSYKGSGIGLAICKKIADLHGGTMAIESEPGKGTTVCCFFPIQ